MSGKRQNSERRNAPSWGMIVDMDNYSEQLVARRRNNSDIAKLIGIGLGTILVASAIMFFAIMLGFFSLVIIAVLILFLGVWLMSNQSIEYEYILTNDEIDIDKIIGRRKRKRMITLNLKSAEEFAQYPPEKDSGADATVYASSGTEQDAYYLLVNHSGYGRVKLIFNPNEKMRESIIQELPNALRVKIKHNVK